MVYYPTDSCAGATTDGVRLQDWLHSGDEFSIAFKMNYISEDLLLVTVTSRFILYSFELNNFITGFSPF